MRTEKNQKNFLISGIFIFALLLIVSATIFMLNKENPIFSSRVLILTEVKNAQNLKLGAAVQLKGIKVGSVRSINFKDLDTLTISIGVNREYEEWIKKDSYIAFKTQGVLGDKFLEILGGSNESKTIEDGDHLRSDESSFLDHVVSKGEDLLAVASHLLSKVDKMMSSVEQGRIEKILKNIEQLTNNSNKIMSSLNDKNINLTLSNLKQSSENMSKITKQIEDGPGTLHALIYDQGLHEDLRSLVGGANRNKVLKYFIRETIKKKE